VSFELTFEDDSSDLFDSRISDAIDALTSADAKPSASPFVRVESPSQLSDELSDVVASSSTGGTPLAAPAPPHSGAGVSVPPVQVPVPVDLSVQSAIEPSAELAQSAVISLQARIDRYDADTSLDGHLSLPRSDAYLRPFVRVGKLDTERALLRLVMQRQWLHEHVDDDRVLHRLAAAMFRTVLRRGAVQPLSGVDSAGRACLLVRVRLIVNSPMDTANITRLAVYTAARWLRERCDVLALRGATILVDWRDADCGTREIAIARSVLDALQRRWPVRVGAVLVIGAPVMATMAWRLLRAVVSAKLAARVKFCSECVPVAADAQSADAKQRLLAELATHGIDAGAVPRDLGGANAPSDDAPWVARLEADESELVTLTATKDASVERLGAKVDPDNKFRMLSVGDKSFAAQLDLRVDDWIVKFNGADVLAITDLKVRAGETCTVQLLVLRPTRTFNVTDSP
jgi:hypothetical protein